MGIVAALVLGLCTGLHAATWGAYKDSPFEGFHPSSFVRSVLVGATASVVFAVWHGHSGAGTASVIVAVGAAYALERLCTEWWKSFVRVDDQSAYSIPMRIAVSGQPVDRWQPRVAVGVAVIGIIVATGVGLGALQRAIPGAPAWLVILVVGGLGGWATAVGGAWKDAPIEGFSGWKFLRSPVVATTWAVPMSLLTTHWFLIMLAAGGLSVASIETYKSFFTGGRPPGKFATQPVLHHRPVLSRGLGRLHGLLWAVFGLALAATLPETPGGVSAPAFSGLSPQLPNLVLTTVAICASLLAVLVLDRNGHLGRVPRSDLLVP